MSASPERLSGVQMLRKLWQEHRIPSIAFLLALLVALLFALRLALFTLHWHQQDHRFRPPEAWMTPGFVAHAWHVDKHEVWEVLGYGGHPGKPMTIGEIAEARGLPQQQVLDSLKRWLLERDDNE